MTTAQVADHGELRRVIRDVVIPSLKAAYGDSFQPLPIVVPVAMCSFGQTATKGHCPCCFVCRAKDPNGIEFQSYACSKHDALAAERLFRFGTSVEQSGFLYSGASLTHRVVIHACTAHRKNLIALREFIGYQTTLAEEDVQEARAISTDRGIPIRQTCYENEFMSGCVVCGKGRHERRRCLSLITHNYRAADRVVDMLGVTHATMRKSTRINEEYLYSVCVGVCDNHGAVLDELQCVVDANRRITPEMFSQIVRRERATQPRDCSPENDSLAHGDVASVGGFTTPTAHMHHCFVCGRMAENWAFSMTLRTAEAGCQAITLFDGCGASFQPLTDLKHVAGELIIGSCSIHAHDLRRLGSRLLKGEHLSRAMITEERHP